MSRSPRRSKLPALLAACALLGPGNAGAATSTPPASHDPAKYAESTQVVSVEVPVNVVDRDGNPIRGLKAEDFTVYDDGTKRPLSGFTVTDLTTTTTTAPAAAPAETAPVRSEARRHFLLLFDLSFSSPTAILRARLAARDFVLGDLHPQDLAAIATYSLQNGPKLVVTFTADRAQLARGIDTLGMQSAEDLIAKRDPLKFMIAPALGDMAGLAGEQTGIASAFRAPLDAELRDYMQAITQAADRSERQYDESRIKAYTRGLGHFAHVMSHVPGRKQVIYFSEGFDSRLLLGNAPTTMEAQQDAQNSIFGEIWKVDSDNRWGNTQLQDMLFRMMEEFRRADCAVQAIDIGGLRADVKEPTEHTHATGQEVLFYLANETGGELYRNANDFRSQLGEALERTELTYLLTFERSDLKADGAYHRLKVEVKNVPAAARVSYRPGYYGPVPFKDLDPMEKNLLAGDGIASAVPRQDVRVHALAAPFRASQQQAYVPIVLEIDGHSLLAGHGDNDLDTEIYVYASDAKGQMRDFLTQKVRMDLAKDQGKPRRILETAGLKYYGHLDLPPGDYRLRVLVRDAQTGRTGVESLLLTVPSYAAAEPYLLPPLFMSAQEGWVMVREKTDEQGAASVVYPFTVKGEPYVPAAHPVLPSSARASICLVGYNLGETLEVEGTVLRADGQRLPAGKFALVERTATGISGLDKLLATFDAADLAAGDYVLQVAIENTTNGTRQLSSLPFTIR